jgi:hypothetical protein
VRHDDDRKIPVFAHNASFDISFILKGFSKRETALRGFNNIGEVKFIGSNINNIRYVFNKSHVLKCSLQYFPMGLDKLVDTMEQSEKDYVIETLAVYLKKNNNNTLNDIALIKNLLKSCLLDAKNGYKMSKFAFPYEFVESIQVLNETKTFPPHEVFYSKLKNSNVSLHEYEMGVKLFKSLDCKNLGDYMEIYNILDVLQLAAILDARSKFLQHETSLDIKEFTSMSEFTKNAQLKTSNDYFLYIYIYIYICIYNNTNTNILFNIYRLFT